MTWGCIFIFDFAYISQKYPSDPKHFLLTIKKYLHCHPAAS